ncbi:hypothetical protein K438DRAFT_1952759 [Mycena galopus ATCC 62051]|nr:hypothetical protein K438DRAFT_1952759 [Mycena galopus ATCC 62051]
MPRGKKNDDSTNATQSSPTESPPARRSLRSTSNAAAPSNAGSSVSESTPRTLCSGAGATATDATVPTKSFPKRKGKKKVQPPPMMAHTPEPGDSDLDMFDADRAPTEAELEYLRQVEMASQLVSELQTPSQDQEEFNFEDPASCTGPLVDYSGDEDDEVMKTPAPRTFIHGAGQLLNEKLPSPQTSCNAVLPVPPACHRDDNAQDKMVPPVPPAGPSISDHLKIPPPLDNYRRDYPPKSRR